MIELAKTILTSDRVVVPAGVRLNFVGGKAKYQGHPIERALVPLEVIKGAGGPFLNACCATVLNDNRGFQQAYGKRYKDWAHCITVGDYLIVYIWDTRVVIDVIPGLHAAAKGGPIVRRLINEKTGERINQVLGHSRFGWSKSLYEMMMWPQYHRPDNGLPLVTSNAGWKDIIDSFNQKVQAKYAYESFDEAKRAEYAKQGQAMPDGSYPITDAEDLENAVQAIGRAKDYEAVKSFIIKRAHELGRLDLLPESWGVNEGYSSVIDPDANVYGSEACEAVHGTGEFAVHVFRYNDGFEHLLGKNMKLPAIKAEPWMHIGIMPSKRFAAYCIFIWDTRVVLCSSKCSYEQAMQMVQLGHRTKSFAIDNGLKLKGQGSELLNRVLRATEDSLLGLSSSEDYLNGTAEAEGIRIVPADGRPNTHLILLGDTQVGMIMAKKLECSETGYVKHDDGSQTSTDDSWGDDYNELRQDKAVSDTDEEATPISDIAYVNDKADNKLLVVDNAGNQINLACLDNDYVLQKDIIAELAKHFGATENLSDDLFVAYSKCNGKDKVGELKVIFVNDLYELCMLYKDYYKELPQIDFEDNQIVNINAGKDNALTFDFHAMTVSGPNKDNIVKTFIKTHFSKALTWQ